MWILKLGRLKLALRILVLTHKLCHGLTSTLESSYTCVLDMQYVSANTSNVFPFGQCSLFFIHTICSIVLATTKNFSAHAQLPVSASAANVLHVIQHFHVIIIHHSLFFFFSTKLSLKENSALRGALCQLSAIVMCPCQPLLMSDRCVGVAPLLLVRVIKRSRSTPQHNFSVIRAYFLPFLHT